MRITTSTRISRFRLLALGALALFTAGASAQSGAGSIQGTVRDTTEAVIPGATIHIVNDATGVTVDLKTNKGGFYIAPELFQGNYTIDVTAPTLGKYEKHLTLAVSQNAQIDVTLTPESVVSQVTVEGGTNQLATYDNATVGSTLDNQRIEQLPVNGRSIATLIGITTPGVEGGRVNGNREAAFDLVQDGAVLANRNNGGNAALPDQDAIQEVRVETNNSSAKFNRPATGIITTKSGTNSIRGSIFETARNNFFGVAKARQDPYDAPAPKLIRNEFGINIGGPIYIPKVYDGRNKSFFFFAYERLSLRNGLNEQLSVPTVAMRNGDFSGIINPSTGLPIVIYDPNTTDPVTKQRLPFNFGGPASCTAAATATCSNKIDPARISPLAKYLHSVTPLPTNASNPQLAIFNANQIPYGISGNLQYLRPNSVTIPTYTFRLDNHFSDRSNAYLRFSTTKSNNQSLLAFGAKGPITTDGTFNISAGASHVFSTALGFNHIFSPSFYSETIVSSTWEKSYIANGVNRNGNIDFNAAHGLPDNFPVNYTPDILGLLGQNGGQGSFYSGSSIITVLDENLTKVLSKQLLQFGFRYRHERIGISPDQNPPNVTFGTQGTGLVNASTVAGKTFNQVTNTGFSEADFFLGAAQSYSTNLNQGYQHYRDQEVAFYFQDDYRLTKRLTLNAGIRYELHPAFTERDNLIGSFDLKNDAVVTGRPIADLIASGRTTQPIITQLQNIGVKFETAQEAGLPSALTYANNFTLSPRVGIAYKFTNSNNSAVLRGGYGRYIYPIPTRNFYATTRASVPYTVGFTQSYTSSAQNDGQPNYLLRNPLAVIAGLNSSDAISTNTSTSLTPGVGVAFLNPHFPVTYVAQGNLTYEQPLRPSSVLRITYSYNHGTNLEQNSQFNTAPSTYVYETLTGQRPPTGPGSNVALNPYDHTSFGNINEINKTGLSYDNSLQINYQRLYKKGYAFQFYYVFSKATKIGGNAFRDSTVFPAADFLPGFLPGNGSYHDINHFLNYVEDTSIPRHRYRFNGIIDLPLGKGKRYLAHSGRLVDELLGGFQIAGVGTVFSQSFQPGIGQFGQSNGIQVFKHKYPITDCSRGPCNKAFQYFNGFIGDNFLPGATSPTAPYNTGRGVYGLPANYAAGNTTAAYEYPFVNGAGNNNAIVPVAGSPTNSVPYSPGPGTNVYNKTVIQGPFNYTVDLSVFKVFRITEHSFFRVNVDAFNALNVQGYLNPDVTTGIENLQNSFNTPRQIQLSGRLTF